MQIKINKEIQDFTESIYFGLTLRQCIYSALACAMAVLIYFSLHEVLGTELTSWICMLGAAPFAALGFIHFQEQNAEDLFIVSILSYLLTKTDLIDQPYNLYNHLIQNKLTIQKKEKGNHAKKFFKNKKT